MRKALRPVSVFAVHSSRSQDTNCPLAQYITEYLDRLLIIPHLFSRSEHVRQNGRSTTVFPAYMSFLFIEFRCFATIALMV
jgi:hypothetical protein